MAGPISGICVAGSCFTVAGVSGAGGSGGVMTTSSTAASASATTGAGGAGGGSGSGGGEGLFHFAGGGCSAGGSGEGRLAWLLCGLLALARRRPERARVTSTRGARDA